MWKMKPRIAAGSGDAPAKPGAKPLPIGSLDRGSFVPMYAQIQTRLLGMIQSGQLRSGDRLPSEEELSRVYGVSRMTARQAVQALKSQGFATRHKGRGTFVEQPKVEKDITHLLGFTAEMRALGLRPGSRVLAAETIAATDEIAGRLAINVGTTAFRLCRLRLADELPVAIEEVYLPVAKFPGIQKLDFARLSLYQTLRQRYHIGFGLADEILEAQIAGRMQAQLLEIPLRSSLLVISRTLRDVDGEPVETSRSSYRADRYRAVLRIPATMAG